MKTRLSLLYAIRGDFMRDVVFILVFIGMVAFALLYLNTLSDVNLYKDCYDEREKHITRLTKETANLKLENMQLRNQLLLKSMYKPSSKPVVDKEMMDAVKYAMKAAHPDNGGKQEDFIKFNALYKKIR